MASTPSSVGDTPTRAARVSRPQTRAWKQLITDATNRTTASAAQRARLRAHLAAAERLATKRRSLHSTSRVTKSKPTGTIEPKDVQVSKEDVSIDGEVKPLFADDASWVTRVHAFNAFTSAPSKAEATSVAVVLPAALRDLRGKVVLAAADAAVAAAPLLNADVMQPVLEAAIAGAIVSKRVMADPCERAALALVRDTLDESVWHQVVDVLNDDHVPARLLAVKAVSQLVQVGSPACSLFISSVAKDAIRVAAVDKAVEVRDGARELVARARSRFGEEFADSLLAVLPDDVRTRFTIPFQNDKIHEKPPAHPQKRNPPSNLRDLIKARKAAARKERLNADLVQHTIETTVEKVEDGDENINSQDDIKTSVVLTFR